jgi:LacI family transcriptional regulator
MGGNSRHFEADFHRIDIPCVLVTNDGSGLPFPNLSSVCSNDDQAVQELMERLVQMGHRKIAIIGGDRQISDTTKRRYQGALSVLGAHGIEFDPDLDYVGVRFSSADGYKGAELLLTRNRNHTAIFCMADVMAMGAIRALSDHGLRVPEDVSVVGFDGLPIGDYTVPRLATVSQSVKILAQRSVELLTKSIEGTTSPVHEVVPAQPLWRESAREI